MTPIILSKKVPWFGEHTGYQQLPRYLRQLVPETQVHSPRQRFSDRVIGKAYSLGRGWSRRNQLDAAAEYRFERAEASQPVRHVLHLEEHLWFLDRWTKAPKEIVGTLHLPRNAWTEEELNYVSRLSSAIVLYQRDIKFYETIVGAGRVHFIPHGVDIDFFRPAAKAPDVNDLLFTGHYLRNTRMLARIVPRLAAMYPSIRVHILVAENFRRIAGLAELSGHPNVVWHERLSDEQLRDRIAASYLLLLPMNNSGANTAVVEAMACGTPIVSTDVGGIRDYGGGDLYPIVANNDDDAMLELVKRYIEDPEWRNETGRKCREFAERELAWPLVARQHLETYGALLGDTEFALAAEGRVLVGH